MKPHTTSTLDTAKHQGTVRGRCIAGTQLQLGLGMGKEGRGKGGGGGGWYCPILSEKVGGVIWCNRPGLAI